ncbi:flagellar hook-associated protein FlgL [Ralstonia flaminis]|jgi:flagellar hook-associated protein 3 FlgL|uniref:Flagellar hook-associated protein 3 n=2 Tax=Ralstonia TaxID=48736 RepID=A0ABN9JF00_9RALS|nr:flagellar hook-associated protein FlgL [Ralstonia sp. LMG 18101]CAJ0809465.1 Flagellar hook-associated protein 3 [Ralstonia sp. LMG 18101]
MRVSTAQFFAASTASMQNTQSNLMTLQQQLASGIALTSAGDNPSAFGQMSQLQQTQDANDQYQTNRDATDARLTTVSSALTDLVNTLQQGKQSLVTANTTLMTDSQRIGVLAQVKQQYQQLLATANQRDASGVALFGGAKGTTDPFVNTGGSVQYVGSGQPPTVQVSQNISMPNSVSGDSVFVRIANTDPSNPSANQSIFKTYENLITALSTPINPATQATDVANLQKAVQTAQGNLDNAYQVALQAQVTVGTQQAQITTLNSSGSNYGEQLKEQISKLQSVDYTTAISQFTQQQVSLQAAQKTFTAMQGMTLFQYFNP